MDEILSIKKLIEMLSMFPPTTPFLNAPTKPHAYLKTQNIAFVVGQTVFDQNPTKDVSEVIHMLQRMIGMEYHVELPLKDKALVYLVDNMHHAGEGVIGIKITSRGITLIKENRF